MAEVTDSNTIEPEIIEAESDQLSQKSGTLAKEATVISMEEGKIMPDNGYQEVSDGCAEESTDCAKQSGDLEANSDIPEGVTGKTSLSEDLNYPDIHVKSDPTSVIVGPNKLPTRSRYLSASVGSCHDLCKYGHKHEQEKKKKKPVLRATGEVQPIVRISSYDQAKSVLNEKAKKKAFNRCLSHPVPVKDSPVYNNMCSIEEDKSKSCRNSGSRNKTGVQAGKMVIQSSNVVEDTSPRAKEIKTRKESGSHSKDVAEKSSTPVIKSRSPKTPPGKYPRIKARQSEDLRSSSRTRNQKTSEEPEISGFGDVSEKTLHITEPTTDQNTAKEASEVAPPDEGLQCHVRINKGSKVCQRGIRIRRSSFELLSAPVSTASITHEHSQHKGGNDQNLNSLNTKQNGKLKTDVGSKTNMPRAKPTLDSQMNTKNTKISLQEHPEEKVSSSWKVKFRRGTEVALHVASSAPKKLGFNRARVISNDQKAKVEIAKILKDKGDMSNESRDTKRGTKKVHLRHQNAPGRKGDVDLNNVIEETASELVKSRKSKVKALVGAFETVMSLHDSKPLVETGAS